MSKKILIISSIILLIFALTLAGYYFLIQSNEKVSNGQNPSINDFFPFGSGPNDVSNSTTTDFKYDPLVQKTDDFTKKLRLISREPVAGNTFINNKNLEYIRYIEKATGHIYDVALASNDKVRISNTTIPQVFEAYFSDGGNGLITRYLDNSFVNTYFSKINGFEPDQTLNAVAFTENIKSVSISPSQKNIFYIENKNNISFGLLQKPPSLDKKQVWVWRPTQINTQMLNDKDVLVFTKPNSDEPGFGYILDTNTGKMKNIFRNILGLTAKGDSLGNKILLYSTANTSGLYLYDIKNDTNTILTPTTFPEKCVFSPNTKSTVIYCGVPKSSIFKTALDDWYMGSIAYSDDIWKYNISSSTAEKVLDLKDESGEDIDIYEPSIDSSGLNMTFRNKINGSLWNLNLTN
jgi:hypothetical protein